VDGVHEESAEEIVRQFHRLYYREREQTWQNTYWLGVPAHKCPLDLWIYQELFFKTRPDVIVESGTRFGGSALFLACMCELVGTGRVITIDVDPVEGRPEHPRLSYVEGSSVQPEVVAQVSSGITAGESVMVVLDSDHHKVHVLEELRLYSPMVTTESYLVVEDTNLHGNPVQTRFLGPAEAVEEFLRETDDFEIDRSCEKFFMTFNPGGFLKRVNRSVGG
jgi:cephalosporin hydroxylase